MATIFTRIIRGELPARFVWRDDECAAFLTIAPMSRGHTLVVPVVEVDHWLDLEPSLVAHLMDVTQKIGKAQMEAFSPARVGVIIAGLEVPHVHVHAVPFRTESQLSFANADHNASAEALDGAAAALREALVAAGHPQAVTR